MTTEQKPHRVVVIGGGFGGLQAALKLSRMPVEVTLVDRRNFHLFQPLAYQVATGSLSPAEICYPLRRIFRRRRNVRVVLAEVTGFDLEHRLVLLGPIAGEAGARGDPLRHADRLGRRALQLLRPRPVAAVGDRSEGAGGSADDQAQRARGARGRRARARSRAPRRVGDVRARRCRTDRCRDGRARSARSRTTSAATSVR